TKAYEDVRSDTSSTVWAVFKYDGKNIIYDQSDHGDNYDDVLNFCEDDNRFYAFVRIEAGDEMSKRSKFVLITWVGKAVPPLKKAKVSTDKAFVKEACPSIALDILSEEKEEITLDEVTEKVKRVGGANYGTGQ
uniref:coactosin family protein n=2 Tax=unclassified Salmonella TaxID=2614656 RepID=UPI0037546DC7